MVRGKYYYIVEFALLASILAASYAAGQLVATTYLPKLVYYCDEAVGGLTGILLFLVAFYVYRKTGPLGLAISCAITGSLTLFNMLF